MDETRFREAIETAKDTQLRRLGSNKLLVALTDADLDRETVLRVAAHSEHAARETFERWAADESNPDARQAFSDVAAQEADHLERVLAHLDDKFELADGGTMHAYLRGRTDTVERVATGMVGRPLVSARAHTQIVSFFVNEADEETAELFRALKTETEAVVDDGLDLLAKLCETDEDWDRAQATAEYVVQVAYDDYADSLGAMGLDPKPVC